MGSDEMVNAAEETGGTTGSELETTEPAPPAEAEAESAPHYGWTRRAFFQAAALGAAAAAFLDGKRFAPSIAWANDLSTDSCTANDVQINGPGVILNEPCSCTPGGTFPATVAFPVFNNTNTNRYCVALHLIPTTVNGVLIAPPDIVLTTTPGGSDSTLPGGKVTTTMYGTIANYPCNAPLACFGQAGVVSGKCAPGTCSTIAWNTSTGAANCTTADQSPSPGQCRHQQICIQGFGACLLCSGTDCTSGISSCSVGCGSTATLTAVVAGGTTPYKSVVLHADDGTPDQTVNNPSFPYQFSVTPTKPTTNYTITVTDGSGCQRMASATLTATAISPPSLSAGTPGCDGTTTITASPSGLSNYVFTVNGTQHNQGSTNTLTLQLPQGQTSTATVTVTDKNGCSNTSKSISVPVPAQVAGAGAVSSGPDCLGNVTLKATGSGGSGTYTFKWFDNFNGSNTQIGTGSTITPTLAPGDHTITVVATDSSNCASAPAGVPVIHVNNPVSVTSAHSGPDCSGNVTLTATPSGGNGSYTYQWLDGTTKIGTTNPLMIALAQDGKDHSITVTVTDTSTNQCSATSTADTVHVNLPVSTSLDPGSTPDCTGHLTFTASASGGTGTYTYAWKLDGNVVAGNSTNTLAYAPNVDCGSHTVTVTATDSAGCASGNSASRTVTQSVATTVK